MKLFYGSLAVFSVVILVLSFLAVIHWASYDVDEVLSSPSYLVIKSGDEALGTHNATDFYLRAMDSKDKYLKYWGIALVVSFFVCVYSISKYRLEGTSRVEQSQ